MSIYSFQAEKIMDTYIYNRYTDIDINKQENDKWWQALKMYWSAEYRDE